MSFNLILPDLNATLLDASKIILPKKEEKENLMNFLKAFQRLKKLLNFLVFCHDLENTKGLNIL